MIRTRMYRLDFMKKTLGVSLIGFLSLNQCVAAEVSSVSATSGILKMALGLVVVLAVMALITWVLKRVMPNGMGQQSVAKIVGGVSVGSRERVVVIEVAGRWIVVGVAPGQVNGLANLEIGDVVLNDTESAKNIHPQPLNHLVAPFSQWLKKSAEQFKK